jgi:hypothetical protein
LLLLLLLLLLLALLFVPLLLSSAFPRIGKWSGRPCWTVAAR